MLRFLLVTLLICPSVLQLLVAAPKGLEGLNVVDAVDGGAERLDDVTAQRTDVLLGPIL
jgi:hypothetical protein